MIRARSVMPQGHGEVLQQPPSQVWPQMIEENADALAHLEFTVAGMPASEVRSLARDEAIELATASASWVGCPVRAIPAHPDRIVMTGHQPEFYHPGVWSKVFAMQAIADRTGAVPLDVIVDSDAFQAVVLTAPCVRPTIQRCHGYLALGGDDRCYAGAPVPDASARAVFRSAGDALLATLSAPALRRHFDEFCDAMDEAVDGASDLAEFMTSARRRYESSAGTDYAEVRVTDQSRGEAFRRFVVDIISDPQRIHSAYNDELRHYRAANGMRSVAQPFPDLGRHGELWEMPFWYVHAGRRSPVWVRMDPVSREDAAPGGVISIVADGAELTRFTIDNPDGCVAALGNLDGVIAPRALTLTLFERLFVADLFIHGVGGGRYDVVTDGVSRRLWGVAPPPFVVASLTLYLPLGLHVVSENEVEAARDQLNRVRHNPDQLLFDIEFETPGERLAAERLARRKTELVEAIGAPTADRKTLGSQIREVNAELAVLLEPLAVELQKRLTALEEEQQASEVLTDRTYPFCLWSPHEVRDKVV